MPRESTSLKRTWLRWRATPSDLARIARRMEEYGTLAQLEDNAVQLCVDHAHGQRTYDGARDAEEHLDFRALEGADTITLTIGGAYTDDLTVRVFSFKGESTVLAVEADGEANVLAPGIFGGLSEELDRGDRAFWHERSLWIVLSALTVVLGWGGFALARIHSTRTAGGVLNLVGSPFALLTMYIYVVRPLFVPRRELLPDGAQSRSQRWGSRAGKIAWAATGMVLSGLIGFYVNELMR